MNRLIRSTDGLDRLDCLYCPRIFKLYREDVFIYIYYSYFKENINNLSSHWQQGAKCLTNADLTMDAAVASRANNLLTLLFIHC